MFEWMAWTTPVAVFFSCIVLMLIGMTVWEIVAHRAAQGLSADGHHARRPPVHRPAARPTSTWPGWVWRKMAVASLEAEPSVWISFVLSMALLALMMRKG
jgi:predicted small integral membrane protein